MNDKYEEAYELLGIAVRNIDDALVLLNKNGSSERMRGELNLIYKNLRDFVIFMHE